MTDQIIDKITYSSPEAKSLDITQQNIEQLRQIFPDVFSENKIDFEALKAVLGEEVDDSAERYNFTWNGKTKARQIAQTPSTGTLRPSKEESVNWDTTENLFIEGDNLEVLKLLQKSYHRQVKTIYIDPPYNTGKDFVYKDNFRDNIQNYLEQTNQVDEQGKQLSTNSDTSGRYHSDWLNMMYPRLKLARNLLRDDGLVFISIDENEYENLKKCCDEIFGEDNFLGTIIWKNKFGSGAKNTGFITVHEYIICYSKEVIYNITSELSESELKKHSRVDEKYDVRGGYRIQPLMTKSMDDRPNLVYPIVYNGKTIMPDKQWVWSEERMKKAITDNNVDFLEKADGSIAVNSKQYLKDEHGKERRGKPTTFFDKVYTQNGTKELADLFGKKVFDFNKPVDLVKYFLSLQVNDIDSKMHEDIILDFFAGSGTTAQSVIELNKKDGGNRRYIMVQLPEKTTEKSSARKNNYDDICAIAKDRIQKAEYKLDVKVGYKVFKLDETNIRTWDADFDNLEQVLQQATESIKTDRSNEDVLYEILLKYGIELTVPIETEVINSKQVFVIGAGALIVCLDDGITSEVVEGIAKLKHKLDPETTQVVFKDAGFADSNEKTNAIQILKQAGIDDVKSI
tara:strand:- start:512 stop:2386 length:1875 start_codon:yes stop_codon:yes gene_type:complete